MKLLKLKSEKKINFLGIKGIWNHIPQGSFVYLDDHAHCSDRVKTCSGNDR